MVVHNTEVFPAVICFLEAEQYLQALHHQSNSFEIKPDTSQFHPSVSKRPSGESQHNPSVPNGPHLLPERVSPDALYVL
jgi:hypothetical protein